MILFRWMRYGRQRDTEHAFPLKGFNLLPYRYMRTLRRRHRYRSEFALAALVGFIAASSIQYGLWQRAMRNKLDEKALEQRLTGLQPALAESKRLKAQLTAHKQRVFTVSTLRSQRDALVILLVELGRMPASGVAVTELKYQPDTTTLLKGQAIDEAALNNWVRLLKRSQPFTSVKVAQIQRIVAPSASTQQRDGAPTGITFTLHLNHNVHALATTTAYAGHRDRYDR